MAWVKDVEKALSAEVDDSDGGWIILVLAVAAVGLYLVMKK